MGLHSSKAIERDSEDEEVLEAFPLHELANEVVSRPEPLIEWAIQEEPSLEDQRIPLKRRLWSSKMKCYAKSPLGDVDVDGGNTEHCKEGPDSGTGFGLYFF